MNLGLLHKIHVEITPLSKKHDFNSYFIDKSHLLKRHLGRWGVDIGFLQKENNCNKFSKKTFR